ncbi:MAG: RHS repeat-associated core domain-containing protein [Hafnia sp.]|uniref:RHS repeat-associated core domain-containing protein n=1 Tax=Hafnia sp. TaxID=1873498 RepID=UPI002FCA7B5B
MDLLTEYVASIDEELAMFKNNTLITQDYRDCVTKWAKESAISGAFGGPTLEMERVISINGTSTTASQNDSESLSAAIVCPKNRKITVVIKHESTLDLPIPDVNVELFHNAKFSPDSKVGTKKTDADGKAEFDNLTPGERYYARTLDDSLESHNQEMLAAYDVLSQDIFAQLSASWASEKPQWTLSAIATSIAEAFATGLCSSVTDLWDDTKVAYNIISDPVASAEALGQKASGVMACIGNLGIPDINGILNGSKDLARDLMAFFNDEAALYLFARAAMLRLRMFPFGDLLASIAGMIGDILSGVIFGALLSLVAAPVGVLFLASKLGKLVSKGIKIVQEVWIALNKILSSIFELVGKFFSPSRKKNHIRQTNAKLGADKETNLGSNNHTELEDERKTHNSPSEDSNGNPENNTTCTESNGCPVSMVNGEELLRLEDASLLGIHPFSFVRQYRSSSVECDSVFGYGWSHSLQHSVRFTDEHIIWLNHENLTTTLPLPDQQIPSGVNPIGKAAVWLGSGGDEYLLSCAALEGWVMHVKRAANGEHGLITGFSNQQQHLNLHYENGLPTRLDNPAGAALQLRYSKTPHGTRLTSVVRVHNCHALMPDTGHKYFVHMRYEYDTNGQLCAAINAAGETERYAYRDDYLFTLRQLAGGAEFYWEWDGQGKSARAIRHWSNLPNLDRSYQWDIPNGCVTVCYEDGNQEVWQHDIRTARLLKSITADGGTTENHYGTQGELLSTTDPLGQQTQYSYNRDNQVIAEHLPDGQWLRYRYSRGHRIEKIHVSADGLAKHHERWRYDQHGNVSHYIDAEGHTTQYAWSNEGALTRIHFPDDSYEAFSVNALGQVFEHTARDGVVTHYRYDEQGRLVFQGERPPHASDSNLSPNATQFAWDNADRLVAIRWPNGQIKRWQYNAYNQITLEQDELGNQTQFEYLPHSTLLKHIIYANGTSEEYRYDNIHGQVSDIINARHERYHIDYTPSGLVSQEQTFDGRRLCWEYDASGSVAKRTEYGDSLSDNTSLVTTYQRDVVGRLSSKTTPDGVTVTYGYDGFGRLNLADDTVWPLAWQYDKRGRLTQEHQCFASQHYAYDAAGNLTQMRLPDGQQLDFLHHNGRTIRIDLDGQLLTEHGWRNGQEITRRHGELVSQFIHDPLQRLQRQQVQRQGEPNLLVQRDYTYDAVGNLASITDQQKGSKTFSHDVRGRFTQETYRPTPALLQTGYAGHNEIFAPDATHNVLGASASPELLALKRTTGNRLTLLGSHHYRYDEYGNCIQDSYGSDQHAVRHYRWDGEHRLVGFRETRHGNEITSFTYDYDCFGRRVRKHNVLTGESRLFFWQDDRLISECNEKLACPGGHPSSFGSEPHTDALSVRTYIYEPNGNSFRPLAMLGGRGKNAKVFYYINDYLGTPQELVSPSGEIVWSAVYHAYGQQAFTLANHIPQPLRFQGQYHDEESGLSYNRYRYYDVSALRYLSPDPIGLAGGVNAYAYVPSPLSWVDPLGLDGCPDFESRSAALRAAKRDAGIPMGQQPDAINKVPMTDKNGHQVMDAEHKPISTREYHFTRPDGSKIVIQEHSTGHIYGPPGTSGNQGPHFNPREYDYETGHGSRNISLKNLPEHYSFP